MRNAYSARTATQKNKDKKVIMTKIKEKLKQIDQQKAKK